MRTALALVVLPLVVAIPTAGSSPGAEILFNQTGSPVNLVTLGADGTNYRTLTSPGVADIGGSWSPDGLQIVFAGHPSPSTPSEVYVMAADGSNQQRLTLDGPGAQDFSPVWSASGDEIAYVKQVGQADDVWMMRPDGSDQRRITSDGGQKAYLGWQPNGSRLVYQEAGAIFTLLEGDPPLRIATGGEPVWSPDGSGIAYSAADGLWTIGPTGQDPVQVTNKQAAQGPSWSFDGTRIAFVATRIFPELGTSRFGPPARQDIFSVRTDGTDLRRLTGPAGDGYSSLPAGTAPTWWPDGSRLFYLSSRTSNDTTTYQMNADGTCEGPFAPDHVPLFRPLWRPGSVVGIGPIRCADLRFTSLSVSGPAGLGPDSELGLVIDNDGNEVATGVRIELRTSEPSVHIVNGNGGPGTSCSGTPQDLACSLDPIGFGSTRSVFFGAGASKAGNYPISVSVSAAQPDSDPSTNILATGVQVLPCTVVGTYASDILYGTHGPDRICGLTGADMIYGRAGNDFIDSGNGPDLVVGGPGRDVILTKGGDDVVYARDGQRDVIDCGTERDIAIVDRIDMVSHCETVVRPPKR